MTGTWHSGFAGPTVDTQQIWPAPQHAPPQQVSPLPQVVVQGRAAHWPSQYGLVPVQAVPHAPQLSGSFAGLTHWLLQHLKP